MISFIYAENGDNTKEDICLPYFLKGVFFTIQWKVNFQKVWKLTFHLLVKNIQIENPLTDR